MNNAPSGVLAPTTILEKTWEGIPGAILRFPISISLSGKMITEREQSLGLTAQERGERLLDFRMRSLADILTDAPTLIRFDDIEKLLAAKQDAAIAGLTLEPGTPEHKAKVTRIRDNVKLTQEEVNGITEPLPGFPESTPETLNAVALEYFNQEDARGRKVFQVLVEELINDYWLWATPRPTISVSAFMQGK